MTRTLDTTPSQGDRRRTRTYLREFFLGLVGYVLALAIAIRFGDLDGSAPSRFAWALLPLVPALWMLVAVYRYFQRLDEYQRSRLLVQFALSFAVMIVASLTLGLLAAAGLQLDAAPWVIYGAGMIAWGVAALVSAREC